jgi:hypothetical protein
VSREIVAALLLGAMLVVGVAIGCEFTDPIRRACRWAGRKVMPAVGEHSVPAREVWTSARRTPPRLENAAAAGGAPGAVTAWSSPVAPGAVPPDNSFWDDSLRPSSAMSTGELTALDAKVDEYLPPRPVRADMPVTRTQTADHAPWTGEMAVVTDAELDELARAQWVRSQLPEHAEDVTREDMERALQLLRDRPVYGEKPVAQLLEAERRTAS